MKVRNILLSLAGGIVVWSCSQSVAEKGEAKEAKPVKYEANWESLGKHKRVPEWFADSKYGIYFHWGVYSVPAFGSEWYPYRLYRTKQFPQYKEYHESKYGPIEEFHYHDFIPQFTAENYDAKDWANLFDAAGAKFAGPVAQHHDGFAMWDSKVNPWNSAAMGPKKDITGELFSELRKKDIKTIATFHHARLRQRHEGDPDRYNTYNSHYAYHPDYITSTEDPELAKFYGNMAQEEFDQYWLDQVNEVVDKYSPDIIWYDTWLNFIPEEKIQEMAAHYFNAAKKKNQEVLIAYKQNDMPKNIGLLDIEQGGKKDIADEPWMTDITISYKGSWCYTEGQVYKSAAMVLRNMIDVWSKNGVVLLNVSPMADGTINQEQRDVLTDMGDWLKIYGESVYGTKPYYVNGFGTASAADGHHGGQSAKVKYTEKDVRFTFAKDESAVYVHILGKPKAGKVVKLKRMGKVGYAPLDPVQKIVNLGDGQQIDWVQTDYGFELTMPETGLNDLANVFKMELLKNEVAKN
ncbi:alpha-L-fucosidase [Reichenbachiella versicolor]|uniref:alpha-L-fucosidase n=1 Tax=Reichenbachiella versicolor TaxID=1821036 RepID=UPI000D6E8418|nr:alpha-L-fucosidase [Reichenbachiella versicolor]